MTCERSLAGVVAGGGGEDWVVTWTEVVSVTVTVAVVVIKEVVRMVVGTVVGDMVTVAGDAGPALPQPDSRTSDPDNATTVALNRIVCPQEGQVRR